MKMYDSWSVLARKLNVNMIRLNSEELIFFEKFLEFSLDMDQGGIMISDPPKWQIQ